MLLCSIPCWTGSLRDEQSLTSGFCDDSCLLSSWLCKYQRSEEFSLKVRLRFVHSGFPAKFKMRIRLVACRLFSYCCLVEYTSRSCCRYGLDLVGEWHCSNSNRGVSRWRLTKQTSSMCPRTPSAHGFLPSEMAPFLLWHQ